MRIKATDGAYQGSAAYETETQLEVEVTEPRYQDILKWMTTVDGRAASYDFWQRGNYTRRLIHQRSRGIRPIHVRVEYVDEMRWAYRRLALTGLPLDFVYCGKPGATGKIAQLCPADNYFHYDAGWGYIIATEAVSIRGRQWGVCIGNARLLPEAALDWLVEEAAHSFLQGKIQIAPAELIGVDPNKQPVAKTPIRHLTGGISLHPEGAAARTLVDLELPFLDGMSATDFSKFLVEHHEDLQSFQRALEKLVSTTSDSEGEATDIVEEIRHEVAELVQAENSRRLKKTAALLKGAMSTVPASLVVAQQPSDPLLWSVAAGAAGSTLLDLWSQARTTTASPFSLLWKLGVTSPSKVKMRQTIEPSQMPTMPWERFPAHSAHHWLCPPTSGVFFAFRRPRPGEEGP